MHILKKFQARNGINLEAQTEVVLPTMLILRVSLTKNQNWFGKKSLAMPSLNLQLPEVIFTP